MFFVHTFQRIPIRGRGFIRPSENLTGKVPVISGDRSIRWVSIDSVNPLEGDFSHLLRCWRIGFGPCWILSFPRSTPIVEDGKISILDRKLRMAPPGNPILAGIELDCDLAWLLGFCSPAKSRLISLSYHDPIPRLSQLIKEKFSLDIKTKDYSGVSHVPAYNIKLPSALWEVIKPDFPLAIRPQVLRSEELSLAFIAGWIERLYKERKGGMTLAPSPRGDSYTRLCSLQVAALSSSLRLPALVEWRNGFSLSFLDWEQALDKLSPYLTEGSSALFSIMEKARLCSPYSLRFCKQKMPSYIRKQIGKVEIFVLNADVSPDENLIVAQSGLLTPITQA